MDSQQHLTLRLTPDNCVKLKTTVGEATHELAMDRNEFEKFFHHLLRIRAKLDLRQACSAADDVLRYGRR